MITLIMFFIILLSEKVSVELSTSDTEPIEESLSSRILTLPKYCQAQVFRTCIREKFEN